MFQDKTLVCKDCGQEFVFTAGEQEFYKEKGFENEPQRCNDCRRQKKEKAKESKTFYEATCSECGGVAKVPFKPSQERPVYCSECFSKHKGE